MKRLALVLLLIPICVSCGEKGAARKEVFPVTGILLVDDKPVKDLAVKCFNVDGIDKENPTVSSAFTDENGKFAISTYESGDGVPEGKYVLTVMWGKWNLISMQYGGPDQLKGKYSDPKKSEIRFEVKPGQPTDLKTIKLTTK